MKIIILVGFVGVVILFVGKKGVDIIDINYIYGEFVEEGCKGIWVNFLKLGKYVYNFLVGILI